MEVAFTEFISGRAPEKRGNGLKLVREVVLANPIDLFYTSGDAEVRMQEIKKISRYAWSAYCEGMFGKDRILINLKI